MASRATIDRFLSCRSVFRAFTDRGYDAVPVNPSGGQVDAGHGFHCFLMRLAGRLES